jgi:polyhydroxybutyrate depolymerase
MMTTWARAGLGLCLALLLASALLVGCHGMRASPAPELSAVVQTRGLRVGPLTRSYLLYSPAQIAPGAPLVVVLHASRQTAADMRVSTGYGFDELADRHGFVVVYPQGFKKNFNDCRAGARYPARAKRIDDVGFVFGLVDQLHADLGIDRTRVFVAGYSNGGQLAYRLALEQPGRVTAIATFAANLPTVDNSDCRPTGKPIAAMMVAGTRDRFNPFFGGKASVFGFGSRGTVRSARASADYFVQLAGLHEPATTQLRPADEADPTWVEQLQWREDGKPEVLLDIVHGGGHLVPRPGARARRILGKVSSAIDGPKEAWRFFARQPSLPPP